tara:strand:+ start:317 stop:643 length:327 start_codon:yes stop_codon:yes gene_type:complete
MHHIDLLSYPQSGNIRIPQLNPPIWIKLFSIRVAALSPASKVLALSPIDVNFKIQVGVLDVADLVYGVDELEGEGVGVEVGDHGVVGEVESEVVEDIEPRTSLAACPS